MKHEVSSAERGSTFQAHVTQYLLPDGRQRSASITLPISIRDLYISMMSYHYRFEVKVLRTGQVSLTVSDDEGDIDIEICPVIGSIGAHLVIMLQRAAWREGKSCRTIGS